MNPILFLFGYARIASDALNATRLLNLCLEFSFPFHSFRGEEDGSISFACPMTTARKLLRLAKEREITLTVERQGGIPMILARRGKRYGLMLGGLCGAILIFLSGRVVWDVRVSGNERLTSEQVIEELRASGFGVGSRLRDFHAGELENRVLLASNSLSWISIYMDGTVAMVQVLERTAPPQDSPKKPANLIAGADGQIETIELLRGDCLVKVGQAVRAGDLLVSGIYDSQTVGVRFTRAAGRILARTERVYEIEIPLETTEKAYTTEKKNAIWLNFFQKNLKIFKSTGNHMGSCDIIKMNKHFSGPGLENLPLSITVETCKCYEEVGVRRTPEEALELAYEALDGELGSLSKDTQLLRKEIKTTISEDLLILECVVCCIENIAVQSEFEVTDLS